MAKVQNENRVTKADIDVLIPDNLNANKGTEFGQHLIEKSFRELGAGRSILLDKNNKIIAGNKSTETAVSIGFKKVIIIETDGTEIVAVKRTDIDIDSKQGRELALADNGTAKANICWDDEAVAEIAERWQIEPETWAIKEAPEPEPEGDPFEDKGIEPKNQYGVIVMCDSEMSQQMAFNDLVEKGYKCKVVVT